MFGRVWNMLRENVRDVVFGLEDSLVSTIGTITGVAVGSHDVFIVMLTGVVLIVVEAISMAAGSYLSSQSAKELYEARIKQDHARVLHERVNDHESLAELFRRKGFSVQEIDVALAAISRERKMWIREVARLEYRHSPSVSTSPHRAAMIMGVFYVCGGVFTLIPYWVLPIDRAIPFAIIATFAALFGVGVLKATLTGANLWRSGIEVLVVSTIAAAIGYGIGVSLPAVLRGAMAV